MRNLDNRMIEFIPDPIKTVLKKKKLEFKYRTHFPSLLFIKIGDAPKNQKKKKF